MKLICAKGRGAIAAATILMTVIQLHAAEITDKKTCNSETDRLIDRHMAKNLTADDTARVDLIIKDLQHLCKREAFEAAGSNIAEADKLLK
ncbi:MAG: hypothetical protein HKN11_17125 [Rhizobiales bacterium]|nr:hypothetical protein [Hyphomicrobiales bacterium]